MKKQEFINVLRASLNGQVSAEVVSENVTYYEEYINSQIRMGRSEQEVLASLGNPRLIARTIIDAKNVGGQYDNNYGGSVEFGPHRDAGQKQKAFRKFKMPVWLILLLVFAAIFFVMSLVMKLVFFFAPFLMILLFVVFLVKLFRDWLD